MSKGSNLSGSWNRHRFVALVYGENWGFLVFYCLKRSLLFSFDVINYALFLQEQEVKSSQCSFIMVGFSWVKEAIGLMLMGIKFGMTVWISSPGL